MANWGKEDEPPLQGTQRDLYQRLLRLGSTWLPPRLLSRHGRQKFILDNTSYLSRVK